MAEQEDSDSGPTIDDNVIRIQLRKPSHRKWELRTRNLSPGIKFPTIQLFDCEGNLLIETNDDNISIKSSNIDESGLKSSQSLKEKDFKHVINKNAIKKHKTISGDRIYTRIYKIPPKENGNYIDDKISYVIRDSNGVCNIPRRILLNNNYKTNGNKSGDTSLQPSDVCTEISSYKSSDNESVVSESNNQFVTSKAGTLLLQNNSHNKCPLSPERRSRNNFKTIIPELVIDDSFTKSQLNVDINKAVNANEGLQIQSPPLQKSKSFDSFHDPLKESFPKDLSRSKSGIVYTPPQNKISFLNTYLKSLPGRTSSTPDWFTLNRDNSQPIQTEVPKVKLRDSSKPLVPEKKTWRYGKIWENTSENDSMNVPTDVAAAFELKKRLKIYRRVVSEIEQCHSKTNLIGSDRRHSVCDLSKNTITSSSESVDEADLVLNRLRRRILKNKMRAKRNYRGVSSPRKRRVEWSDQSSEEEKRNDTARAATCAALLRARYAMGSNISQHSSKGLKGRRARSSGDLCNGDTKSQTESSVCGSVVGEVMGWNRSLPNHLDGNRHLAEYSRVNNNYGELGTYNRCHPKGGRGLRYRVSKSGSELEPVWKLQDPGCDQGYGSERSPEEDYAPPLQPTISLEEYETQLRAMYPFINDENTFTVVVEKDGRGLGMSVCGGGGLVRIRRLYPPQPAWRTGRLAQRDLLLAANGVPLAGLSTYEALEVLRTAAPRVELRVCRPPPDALESVTPPEPPTPPARTPHPPQIPPPDPLNCHPMHARLSQTTSSATTSSSEGRGRRDASPEPDRRELRLPDLERSLPVYDVQYGEFDIIMSKVNGSLGFTLRKEDHSALGHYVRALVREPALSDGRIQPGDRIVAVNETSMSNMSHAEAVAFLRACGSEVRLRLYRDNAATPLSPMSPREEGPTDSDTPASRPKPPLRAEAVSMLCDLAARRLTPDTMADGSRSPCLSPRKFRKLTKDSNHYDQNDASKHAIDCPTPEPQTENERRRQRTHSLTQDSPPKPTTCRKQKLSLTVPPHGYELNNLDNDTLDAPNVYQEDIRRYIGPAFPVDSDEPVSMPVELSSDETRFSHSNPTYQSAVLHTTSSEGASGCEGYRDDGNGLKKWKGITSLSPDNERKAKLVHKTLIQDTEQKENIKPESQQEDIISEPTIMTVELNRGWNSRLGFSVQSHPDSGQSYISAVYNDSVAARDGRLRKGDVILQVNDENVTSMKTPEVIDLLRILRGSICITILRPPNPQK